MARPHLIEWLNDGLHGGLTLVCAAAGFGKSTLLGEWIASSGHQTAWLSLDDADDPLILVLDDYHAIDAVAVDSTVTFLIEHLPPQLHLVISTRQDPNALLLGTLMYRSRLVPRWIPLTGLVGAP